MERGWQTQDQGGCPRPNADCWWMRPFVLPSYHTNGAQTVPKATSMAHLWGLSVGHANATSANTKQAQHKNTRRLGPPYVLLPHPIQHNAGLCSKTMGLLQYSEYPADFNNGSCHTAHRQAGCTLLTRTSGHYLALLLQ